MKYRKKPVVIEAEQWFEDKQIDGVVHGLIDLGTAAFYIETLEGRMVVSPGDWIITGVVGEKYPCKPHIFAATYEPVESS
jgi:hypothetical protein